ncbi:FAD-dependent oxidoreductase [Mycolicibacterium sp.]|uniref:NAD(P)/FAD-dependent oxidoreductase n=1 Tax=Mycolicibacterium sp. TaxID=2320850 RepID=UPI0025DFB82D|nr:FAD-dependent oxidoreductase [Mycolicibacterium sp.]
MTASAVQRDERPCTVVVGAGHAGGTLVSLLRQHDHDGRLVLIGAEPHPPYHRPPLSKKFFSDDYEQLLRPIDFYRNQGIEVLLDTEVTRIDRAAKSVLIDDGDDIAYTHLVLATGAAARPLPVPGAGLDGVLSLRTLDDAIALRKIMTSARRLVIIGGGYIGLEVTAEAMAHGGVDVTVLEREDRILARVASPEFSAAMHQQHIARGTEIRTHTDVVGLVGDRHGTVRAVQLADGSEITCDAALVGVGAIPRDGLARESGIDCDKGILVDEAARTNDPSIFAIGDVTRRPLAGEPTLVRLESIPSAVEQAKQAAAAITGSAAPAAEVPWFWSDQFDLQLKIAGMVRPCGPAVVRGDPSTGKFALFHLSAENTLAAVETSNSAAMFMAGKKFIGTKTRMDPLLLADQSVDIRKACMTD